MFSLKRKSEEKHEVARCKMLKFLDESKYFLNNSNPIRRNAKSELSLMNKTDELRSCQNVYNFSLTSESFKLILDALCVESTGDRGMQDIVNNILKGKYSGENVEKLIFRNENRNILLNKSLDLKNKDSRVAHFTKKSDENILDRNGIQCLILSFLVAILPNLSMKIIANYLFENTKSNKFKISYFDSIDTEDVFKFQKHTRKEVEICFSFQHRKYCLYLSTEVIEFINETMKLTFPSSKEIHSFSFPQFMENFGTERHLHRICFYSFVSNNSIQISFSHESCKLLNSTDVNLVEGIKYFQFTSGKIPIDIRHEVMKKPNVIKNNIVENGVWKTCFDSEVSTLESICFISRADDYKIMETYAGEMEAIKYFDLVKNISIEIEFHSKEGKVIDFQKYASWKNNIFKNQTAIVFSPCASIKNHSFVFNEKCLTFSNDQYVQTKTDELNYLKEKQMRKVNCEVTTQNQVAPLKTTIEDEMNNKKNEIKVDTSFQSKTSLYLFFNDINNPIIFKEPCDEKINEKEWNTLSSDLNNITSEITRNNPHLTKGTQLEDEEPIQDVIIECVEIIHNRTKEYQALDSTNHLATVHLKADTISEISKGTQTQEKMECSHCENNSNSTSIELYESNDLENFLIEANPHFSKQTKQTDIEYSQSSSYHSKHHRDSCKENLIHDKPVVLKDSSPNIFDDRDTRKFTNKKEAGCQTDNQIDSYELFSDLNTWISHLNSRDSEKVETQGNATNSNSDLITHLRSKEIGEAQQINSASKERTKLFGQNIFKEIIRTVHEKDKRYSDPNIFETVPDKRNNISDFIETEELVMYDEDRIQKTKEIYENQKSKVRLGLSRKQRVRPLHPYWRNTNA